MKFDEELGTQRGELLDIDGKKFVSPELKSGFKICFCYEGWVFLYSTNKMEHFSIWYLFNKLKD